MERVMEFVKSEIQIQKRGLQACITYNEGREEEETYRKGLTAGNTIGLNMGLKAMEELEGIIDRWSEICIND
jgi:hypothetical protein